MTAAGSAGEAVTPGQAAGCPFCGRIERGEFDYGDARNVAFEPLNPVTPGHLLVVPRKHFSNAFADPGGAGGALTFAGYLANKLDIGAANFITSAGRDATQTVFHLHVHIVPRREGDGLALPWTGQQAAIAAQQPQPAPESVPWRQGRTQPRNIYARTGGGDWKADLMIGQLDTPAAAAEAVRAHNAALGEQPAPELAAAMGETPHVDALVAALNKKINKAEAERDDLRDRLGLLEDGIGNLAAGLKLSASGSRPSKKSEIEDGCAAALLGILDPR